MPEGPEAEIARRQLERWMVGRRVVDVVLADPDSIRTRISSHRRDLYSESEAWFKTFLCGETPLQVLRHGKRLALCWESVGLIVHLGMTGQWVRRESHAALPHLRVCFQMEEGPWVCFVDVRRFGCLVPFEGHPETPLVENLGPDALETPWTGADLRACFKGKRPIKVALMDQRCLAGLGNIHAVEILWKAGVHPETPVDDVSDSRWEQLADVLPAHLHQVVGLQDGDELVYITQGGDNPFEVYGRQGAICSRCTEKIENKIIQGRSSFFCPSCQVL